jgi:dye decolorizing peroxidase
VTPVPDAEAGRTAAHGPRANITRRDVLLGAGGLLTGAVGGSVVGAAAAGETPAPSTTSTSCGRGAPVPATGRTQAGIARPQTPQPHGLLAVLDLADPTNTAALPGVLAGLGDAVLGLTHPQEYDRGVAPDGPGDLTVTVGIGPRVIVPSTPRCPAPPRCPR